MAVVGAGVLGALAVSIPLPRDLDPGRLLFWILVTLVASSVPVYLPRGINASVNSAPLIAAIFDTQLVNPFARWRASPA